MGTSGNPAKKAAAKKVAVSSASAFKKKAKGAPLELPSGEVVIARRVELQTFIMRGEVPNPLMTIISEALEKGQKADIPAMMGVEEGKVDLDMVNDMYEMVNAVVMACVVEPKVHPLPTHNAEGAELITPAEIDEAKDDDLLYVDELLDEDKMFLFQWASGGTSDLATFRSEAREDMAALAKSQGS